MHFIKAKYGVLFKSRNAIISIFANVLEYRFVQTSYEMLSFRDELYETRRYLTCIILYVFIINVFVGIIRPIGRL